MTVFERLCSNLLQLPLNIGKASLTQLQKLQTKVLKNFIVFQKHDGILKQKSSLFFLNSPNLVYQACLKRGTTD